MAKIDNTIKVEIERNQLPEGAERRVITLSGDLQLRAVSEDGNRFIEGYGALFNHRSRLIMDWEGLYFEELREGAFDNALNADNVDVLMTFNHSRDKILARYTKEKGDVIQNTLQLTTDKRGLRYRFEVPNTTLGNDTFESVKRGDLRESSFVFTVKENDQEWRKTEDGDALRVINSVNSLYDTSIVWKGAYSNTDVEVAKRHFESSNTSSDREDVATLDGDGFVERVDGEDTPEITEDKPINYDVDEMTLRIHQLK